MLKGEKRDHMTMYIYVMERRQCYFECFGWLNYFLTTVILIATIDKSSIVQRVLSTKDKLQFLQERKNERERERIFLKIIR